MRTVLLTTAIGLLLSGAALAGDCCTAPACCNQTHDCCGGCGVRKVCKVVCEMKKVKKTVWRVECEEFCIPNPRCPPAEHKKRRLKRVLGTLFVPQRSAADSKHQTAIA